MTSEDFLKLTNQINQMDSLSDLRNLRDVLAARLTTVKNATNTAKINEIKAMYEGKFILLYGRNIMAMYTTKDYGTTLIYYVNKVTACGDGWMEIDGRELVLEESDKCSAQLGSTQIDRVSIAVNDGHTRIELSEIECIVTTDDIFSRLEAPTQKFTSMIQKFVTPVPERKENENV